VSKDYLKCLGKGIGREKFQIISFQTRENKNIKLHDLYNVDEIDLMNGRLELSNKFTNPNLN
jgi:hypothetical protein